MDLNTQQENKLLNLTCLEHKKPIQFIYLRGDINSVLACTKCYSQNKLDHDYIMEIDDLLNRNEVDNLKKLLPVLSEQSSQYLESESMKNQNKNELIEKVSKQFDEFADLILSNLDKLKKQIINHIISTDDQRVAILKICNQTTFFENLKAKIDQFSNDQVRLSKELREIVFKKWNNLDDDKKTIEDSLKNHMILSKQIDLKYIQNSLESILQKVISTNIIQQHQNNIDSNFRSIIEERLKIYSFEELKSIPNLQQYKNININLQSQNIGDYKMEYLCDVLQQCKNIVKIQLVLNENKLSDKGLSYLCKLISQMKYLTQFGLYINNNFNITEKGVTQLNQALQLYSDQIESIFLDFSSNKNISDQVVLKTIIPMLSSFTHLSELGLYLEDTNIRGNTLKYIANMLKQLSKLKNLYLSLSENNLDDNSLIYFSNEGIESINSSISELYLWLSKTELNEKSAQSLMDAISTCSHLTELNLDLSSNRLGDQFIQQLKQFKLELKDEYCNNLIKIEIDYDNDQ